MKQKSIYSEPLRIYVGLALLAVLGLFCGSLLPVSLFPNSSKPDVRIWVNYGDSTAEEFLKQFGGDLENRLKSLVTEQVKVSEVAATYDSNGAFYKVDFNWGNPPALAEREVQRLVDSWSARVDEKIRNSIGVWLDNESSGFFAASFFSEKRSLDELYNLLEPVYLNRIAQVPDASQPELWNPARKEIKVELKPDALVSLQLLPSDVERAIGQGLKSFDGGSVSVGQNQLHITLPRPIKDLQQLASVPITSRSGRVVHLGDIAKIDFGLKSKASRIIKTSGSTSILLFATPKAGGNIKKMSEDLLAIIKDGQKTLPRDVQVKILVDPSEFIGSAIKNVFHEVAIGSLLAVTILFIFIGSLKNVATAAIEIPLSLVLAFILMKLFNVNLNLISLGGLALSAGMNVDASVVVMENIFRHFEPYKGQRLSQAEKVGVVRKAVAEVQVPIIASTIASLVVFVPLLLTSDLSYGILGDLAKAVVFSHAFSAGVALLLVPTVRLHLLSGNDEIKPHSSYFEKYLVRLDNLYEATLRHLVERKFIRWGIYISVITLLPVLIVTVLPKLPREVVGIPDTDMLVLSVSSMGNTKIRQMETISDEVEKRLLDKFSAEVDYTFTQINGVNRSTIIPRLKNKSHMAELVAALEKEFVNTPQLKFTVDQFNPSELPIPDPPALKISVRGGEVAARRDAALEVKDLLEGSQIYSRVTTEPSVERQKGVSLIANLDQWPALQSQLSMQELVSYVRTTLEGRWVGDLDVDGQETGIFLRFPDELIKTTENIESLPIGINGKIVPLKSFFKVNVVDVPPPVFHKNGDELFNIFGHVQASEKATSSVQQKKGETLVKDWQAKNKLAPGVTVSVDDAGKDITEAINQLGMAIAGSVLLIFIVLLFQFGSVAEPLLILVAVPLGFIGVLTSLFVFKSTLSLNSALGVILLNGIAVNNSIILVDFTKRLWEAGQTPLAAALSAARLRLRPILITSLTSILGMMPIALGLGEGGKILQPLGIAVSGGLWISMLLTLLIVPLLQVAYLSNRVRTQQT
jgi:hydrophobic/amphiphilic exporter-1 (mainly G- bacteria), HAE1 family